MVTELHAELISLKVNLKSFEYISSAVPFHSVDTNVTARLENKPTVMTTTMARNESRDTHNPHMHNEIHTQRSPYV